MIIRPVILSLLLLFSFDCGSSGNTNLANAPKPPDPPANISRTGEKDLSPAAITLERMACNGTCPVYKLTVNTDRTTIFVGGRNTEMLGTHQGTISASAYQELLAAFDKAGFSELLDRYDHDTCPSTAKDHPTVIVSLARGDKVKTVIHDLGCFADDAGDRSYPPGLKELEDSIDKAADTGQWINKK